jgi:two-component system, response regulator PdtaR
MMEPLAHAWFNQLGTLTLLVTAMNNESKKPLEGTRVLLAEDVALVAFDIAHTLKSAGAEIVGPACSVEHAVELAKSEDLSCAVLDVMLHGREVYPAGRVLNGKGAGLLFVTAVLDTARITKEWPHSKLLRKPYSEEQLIEAAIAACSCYNGAKAQRVPAPSLPV